MPGVRPLELDLWLPPDGDGPVPVVVFLHGGGWRLGSRHTRRPGVRRRRPDPFERLAQAGIAVASVDYRLSGEAVWPAQLHDAKAAVRWLRARAGELGVDPDRIAAWGESAGGHLAELLGLTAGDAALEGDVGVTGPSSAVAAVVAWYAPSDLAARRHRRRRRPGRRHHPRGAAARRARRRRVPDLAAQASPISHVSAAAPPFLLLHGRPTGSIPCAQSERLHAALVDGRRRRRAPPVRRRRPHVARRARRRGATRSTARSPSCATASTPDREETTHEDRRHPPTGRRRRRGRRTVRRRRAGHRPRRRSRSSGPTPPGTSPGEPAGPTLPRRRRRVRAAGAARTPG